MPINPVERNDSAGPNPGGFIFGLSFPAPGEVHEISWDEVKASPACPPSGWRWLHFNRLGAETKQWLEDSSGLDDVVITALLQTETRPRCVAHDDGLILNLRGVNHNPGAEPEDMISVRMWAEATLVVTMRSYPVRAVREVREAVATGECPTTPGDLLVAIAAQLVENLEPIMEQLRDDADEYEDTLLAGKKPMKPSVLAEFRQTILLLRRYIQPQREAMAQLQKVGGKLVNPADTTLRETGDNITRIAEELDTIRERAAVLQDQVNSQRQEQLNERLLALSIVSALFLPLTFLTGLLGMNVAGIPNATSPFAFVTVVALMGGVALGLLAFLKLKRWI
jgi:zinc transporter